MRIEQVQLDDCRNILKLIVICNSLVSARVQGVFSIKCRAGLNIVPPFKFRIYGLYLYHRMDAIRAIAYTIGKEIRLELRKGYAIGGLIVFVLCTVFIIYITVAEFPPTLWVALYWVAFLFLSIHTVLKSFGHESHSRFLYYYTLIPPEILFVAKCIYNAALLAILGVLMYGALSLIGGHPILNARMFISAIVAGAIGISLCFTLISGIAIKSDQGATLMTVLSFPVIIPVLLNVVRVSEGALERRGTVDVSDNLLMLGGIDLLLIAMGLLLFPYLWKS